MKFQKSVFTFWFKNTFKTFSSITESRKINNKGGSYGAVNPYTNVTRKIVLFFNSLKINLFFLDSVI